MTQKAKPVHQPGSKFHVFSSLLIEEWGGPRTEAVHALALVRARALVCCYYVGKYSLIRKLHNIARHDVHVYS